MHASVIITHIYIPAMALLYIQYIILLCIIHALTYWGGGQKLVKMKGNLACASVCSAHQSYHKKAIVIYIYMYV